MLEIVLAAGELVLLFVSNDTVPNIKRIHALDAIRFVEGKY